MRDKEKVLRMRELMDKELGENGERQNFIWSPRSPGQYMIRFLPNKGDPEGLRFWVRTFVHYGLPGARRGFLCPRLTFGEDHHCPICEEVARLRRSTSEHDQELARRMTPITRYVVNLLVIKSPVEGDADPERVRIWTNMPKSVFVQLRDLLSVCDEHDNPVYAPFHDWEEGYLMNLKREGESWSDTRYSLSPIKQLPIDPNVFGDRIFDLDRFVREKLTSSEEEMMNALNPPIEDVIEEDEEIMAEIEESGEITAEDIMREQEKSAFEPDLDQAIDEPIDGTNVIDVNFLNNLKNKLAGES